MKEELQEFTPEAFLSHIGQVFSLESNETSQGEFRQPFKLELVEVNTHGMRAASGKSEIRREPFSLLFILQGTMPLGRGLHRLVHEQFALSELFLSRVVAPQRAEQDGAGAVYYEAVFG